MPSNMPSQLQSETSRRNGAKSRGPKTPEGKANSSRNATTHGLLSKTIIIEGENAPRFAALLASMRAELKPRTGIEDGLVEDLASCRWRQRRLLSMETASYTHAILRQDPEAAAESNATRAAFALNHLSDGCHTLELINRYERHFNRQYNRTLHTLYAIRAIRSREAAAQSQQKMPADWNPESC